MANRSAVRTRRNGQLIDRWTAASYLQGLVSRTSSEVSSPLMAKSL